MAILRSFEIDYGTHKGIEVLIDPSTREIRVTYPAIERLLGWEPNNARKKLASKSLKALAGDTLTGVKTVKALDIKGKENRFSSIAFHDFLKVLYWQLKEGNDAAGQLLVAGFADSFSSMALEQAGIQVTLEERQEVLRFYLPRYHELFDWLRDRYVAFHGERPAPEVYQRINTAIDQHLFGRSHFGGDRKKNADNDQLHEIEVFHRFAMRKVKGDLSCEPVTAILQALREY